MSRHTEVLYRVYFTMLVVIAVAMLLSFRAVKIATIDGEKWRTLGDSLYFEYFPVDPQRGDIIARGGELLVTSLPMFEVRWDSRAAGLSREVFLEDVDSLAWHLSRTSPSGKSYRYYRDYLRSNYRKGNRYTFIRNKVNFAELEELKSFPIFRRGQNKGGFIAVRTNKREHPYGGLAERTLGYVRESVQPVGLEGYFDQEMRGVEGKRLMQKVRGAWIPVNQFDQVEAKRGADIVTTLEVRMQDIVHHELLKAVEHHQAKWGTAVLMEVKSGAIRAISNLDESGKGYYYEGYNHAVGSATEPGSTFKLAAVMAMFEDGYANLDTRVDLHNGRTRLHGQDLADSHWHPHRESDLRHAFEISSNVGIATLADNAYGRTKKGAEFIARLKQFGLDRTTGIEVPGEAIPQIKEAYNTEQRWSSTSVPWMSHGYELQITPLQLLTFYNAVANNGKLMKPHLVTEVRKHGRLIESFRPTVVIDRIAKAETIEKAHELLRGVVIRGTGKSERSDQVSFAGKTGTAVVEYFMDSDGRRQYQGSFAGFFPAEDPKYSLVVVLYKPRVNGFYGGDVALPAFRRIAERVMALDPVRFDPVPDTTAVEATEVLASMAYRPDVEALAARMHLGFEHIDEADWVDWKAGKANVLEGKKAEAGIMPDVRGMGVRDAVFLLENAGARVTVRGAGKVKRQSVRTGDKLPKGARIELVLG